MEDRIHAIREAFDALRSNVRPEGDAQAGALSVAIDQAAAAAAAGPAPALPIDALLGNIAADLGALRDDMHALRDGQTEVHAAALALRDVQTDVHAAVLAMREAAGV